MTSLDSLKKAIDDCYRSLSSGEGCDSRKLMMSIREEVDRIDQKERTSDRIDGYNKISQLLPRWMAGPSLEDMFLLSRRELIPFTGFFDAYKYNMQASKPNVVDWNSHSLELHEVFEGDQKVEYQLFQVERMLMHQDRDARIVGPGTIEDPIGHYNCFSLAFHWNKDIPIVGGCIARDIIKPCIYNPELWPSFAAKVFYPRQIIRACHSPRTHLERDGYKRVAVTVDDVRPGDVVVYFSHIPSDLYLKRISEPIAGEWYEAHHLQSLPNMSIVHAAIVVNVTDSDIQVLEKMDTGPAVVSSAFSNRVDFGTHFMIYRNEHRTELNLEESNFDVSCFSTSETVPEAERNPNARAYLEMLEDREERYRNCLDNPKCR